MLLKLSTPCQLDRKIFIWARPYAVELAIFLKLVKKSSYKKTKKKQDFGATCGRALRVSFCLLSAKRVLEEFFCRVKAVRRLKT